MFLWVLSAFLSLPLYSIPWMFRALIKITPAKAISQRADRERAELNWTEAERSRAESSSCFHIISTGWNFRRHIFHFYSTQTLTMPRNSVIDFSCELLWYMVERWIFVTLCLCAIFFAIISLTTIPVSPGRTSTALPRALFYSLCTLALILVSLLMFFRYSAAFSVFVCVWVPFHLRFVGKILCFVCVWLSLFHFDSFVSNPSAQSKHLVFLHVLVRLCSAFVD